MSDARINNAFRCINLNALYEARTLQMVLINVK